MKLKCDFRISSVSKDLYEISSSPSQSLNAIFREPDKVAQIKFPEIPVPKFDGNIRKFHEFQASFKNMIDSR